MDGPACSGPQLPLGSLYLKDRNESSVFLFELTYGKQANASLAKLPKIKMTCVCTREQNGSDQMLVWIPGAGVTTRSLQLQSERQNIKRILGGMNAEEMKGAYWFSACLKKG